METQDQQSYHYWPLEFDKHESVYTHGSQVSYEREDAVKYSDAGYVIFPAI
jgi:hypothetical protein